MFAENILRLLERWFVCLLRTFSDFLERWFVAMSAENILRFLDLQFLDLRIVVMSAENIIRFFAENV